MGNTGSRIWPITRLGVFGVAVALVVLGSASTAGASPKPDANAGTLTEYRAVNITDKGAFSGDWSHCLFVSAMKTVQHPSCSVSTSVTESVGGDVGFAYSVISAQVGFNVSFSTDETSTDTFDVQPGVSGWVEAGFRYERYTAGMEKRTCGIGGCAAWSSPDKVTIQKHLGPTFRFVPN